VIAVRRGEEYAKTNPDAYRINPRQGQHYMMLLSELRDLKRLPQGIVHLWSVGPTHVNRPELDLFEYYQEVGFYSLLYIAQALVRLKVTDAVQIGAVSNEMHRVTGEEQICPAKATLLGACKSIPQEYPNITCRNIDIVVRAEDGRTVHRSAA